MKLLLTSAGLTTTAIKDKFLEMAGKKAEDIVVALVPTAADPEKDKWFIDKDKQVLEHMGMQVKEVDLKTDNLQSKFQDADIIWVEGGNTFYLLYWTRKSGFDKALKNFLDQGKTYVGVSAGSLIAGPSIESAGWKGGDDPSIVKLKDYHGLSFVDFAVFPHYEEKYAELVKTESQNLPYEVKTLTNEQAIAINDSRVKTV